MKRQIQWLLVVIMTSIIVLAIFLLADVAVMGLVAIIISIFNDARALQVFEIGVTMLFIIELGFTIPAVIKTINKGDKE